VEALIPALSVDYAAHFGALLLLEQRQMEADMQLYRRYETHVAPAPNHADLYTLTVPGLQEWRPPTVYGDRVRLRTLAAPDLALDGYVHAVDRRTEQLVLALEVPRALAHHLPDLRVNVDFFANHTALVAMRHALRVLRPRDGRQHRREGHAQHREEGKEDSDGGDSDGSGTGASSVVDVLTVRLADPPAHPPLTSSLTEAAVAAAPISLADADLNWEQRDAVRAAVAQAAGVPGAGRLVVVFGPPGTGKTRTVVEMVRQLLARLLGPSGGDSNSGGTQRAILLTAPSNQAVDIMVTRLSAHVPPAQMLRLNGTLSGDVSMSMYACGCASPCVRMWMRAYTVCVCVCVSPCLLTPHAGRVPRQRTRGRLPRWRRRWRATATSTATTRTLTCRPCPTCCASALWP
jgi:hypothetical protein